MLEDLRAALFRRPAAVGLGLVLAGAVAACGTARPDVPVAAVVTPSSSPAVSPSGAGAGVVERAPAPYASSKTPGASGGSKRKAGPVLVENFDGPLSDEWGTYDTPDGTPPRSGDQVSVSGGMLHLKGGVNTRVGKDVGGGVMLLREQKYGRWEVRFRVQAGAGYAGVVLLWPKENADWPAAGEIDLAEITNPARRSFGSFLHHGRDNHKVGTDTRADFTRFHTIAVDWLPNRVSYYLDGRKYFEVRPGDIETGLPTESVMHLALQLDQGCDDFVPCRTAATPATVTMDVDWVKVYPAR